MRVRLRVGALAAALVLVVAAGLDRAETPVRACGPWRDFPVFTAMGEPESREYFRGKLGIVGGYGARYLVVAWRTFHDRPMTDAELAARSFAPPVTDARLLWAQHPFEPGGVQQWLEARRSFPDAPRGGYLSQWTATPRHDFFLNCPENAFVLATSTLRERRQTLGADNPEFLAWVHAQDQVFSNCDWEETKTAVIPEALSVRSSASARADRAYQIAAALFYSGQLAEAEHAFAAIARDTASPWQMYGRYLAARAMVRQGTVGGRDTEPDLSAFPRAAAALDAILADPTQRSMHEDARRLQQYIAVRWHPADALAAAARGLAAPDTDSARVEQNLIDFDQLLYRASKDTTGYRSGPADAGADDLIDWARTFSTPGDNAHALERWRATRADYWLMAALATTPPDAANVGDVLADAAHVRHESPAFPTVAYYRARLLFLAGQADAARGVLDDALATRGLPASAVNQFRSIRMQLARSLAEFLRDAPRTPVADWIDSDLKFAVTERPREPVGYDRDALDVLNERLPVSLLRRAAPSSLVPKSQRQALAGSIFARAVLLGDAALIRDVLPETRRQVPALGSALAPVAAARSDQDVLDEAWLVLAFHPGLRPFMPPDSYRDPDKLASFSALRDNWWCSFRSGEHDVRPYATQYLQGERRSAAMKDLYPSATDVPWPSFLTGDDRQTAMTEWQHLAALDVGPTELERRVIDWAERHPADARAPHALAQSVRIGHLGCGDPTTPPLSKKAFTLLHQRYPKSVWAQRTPFWYK